MHRCCAGKEAGKTSIGRLADLGFCGRWSVHSEYVPISIVIVSPLIQSRVHISASPPHLLTVPIQYHELL